MRAFICNSVGMQYSRQAPHFGTTNGKICQFLIFAGSAEYFPVFFLKGR